MIYHSTSKWLLNRHFSFPMLLLMSDKYRLLSADSKIVYALLKDILLKENKINLNGDLYLRYLPNELEELLYLSKEEIVSVFDELHRFELIEFIQDQSGHITIYLGELDVDENNIHPQINTSEGISIVSNLYHNQSKETQFELLANIPKLYENTFLTEHTLLLIAKSCQNVQEAKEMINLVYETKRMTEGKWRKYLKNYKVAGVDIKITGENFSKDLEKCFSRLIANEKVANQTDKPIKDRMAFYRTSLSNFWLTVIRVINQCRTPEEVLLLVQEGLPEKAEYTTNQMKKDLTKERFEYEVYVPLSVKHPGKVKITMHNWLDS